ncbi:MAG TPA: ATP-binding protein [Gemmatimonadaceae bacterium]|nr:ATP-binding protein [Gemmatimonadaceae bacterium]
MASCEHRWSGLLRHAPRHLHRPFDARSVPLASAQGLAITNLADSRLRAILEPRQLVRWGYLGRLSLAGAIFVAAVHEWQRADAADTLVASLACVAALVATAGSALYTEVAGRPLTRGFLYLHTVFDLLLVTAVVHLTGGLQSQLSALYILVTVVATLLLPGGRGLLVTALALSCYLADGLLVQGTALDVGSWLQFAVFAAVAGGSTAISARLRELGAGQEELAAELVQFRVQASDILRTIRSGIVTVSQQGRLLYANPAAGALLGIELGRASGRQLLPALARVAPELAQVLERGMVDGVRTTRAEGTITAGGRTFPIGVTTTVSEADGRGTTVTAIFQDISESKKVEALHLRAERLEGVAALGASLAHEIKNPLASIRSAVEQLAAMPQAGEDERTLGGLIVRESDRLARLLSDFLDFARVRVTRIAPVDLGGVAEGAVALVRTHPDHRPSVTIRCQAPAGLVVEGDEDLLHRAVFNLVLNAVQAAGEGSEVRVELAAAEEEALSHGFLLDHGAVVLRVSDSGPGIDPSIRDRLFDPFTTTRPGGTGLGLAVVQRAVEAHRGFVLLDSDEHGTRFTVLLPTRQDDGETASVGRRASSVEGTAALNGAPGTTSLATSRVWSVEGRRSGGVRGAPPDHHDTRHPQRTHHRNPATRHPSSPVPGREPPDPDTGR